MNDLADSRDLTPADGKRLQDLLDRFEQAWQGADSVDLERFLPPAGDRLRVHALRKLLKIDLENHWQRGQKKVLELYLRSFPELAQDQAALPQLIYDEYCVRHQPYGDKPSLSSYRARFPEHFGEFERLVHAQTSPEPAKSANSDTILRSLEPSSGGVPQFGAGYKKIRRLGSGSFGEVWLGEAPGGVEVAIKIIFRPIDHAEAHRELKALELIRRLHHPFLLQTQAYWIEDDRLHIAMELAEENLRDRADKCKAAGLPGIPMPELLKYFQQASEALDYLHSKEVLHRDIKPDNILLLAGYAKLADFGLARLMEKQQSFAATSTGTPAYMAPEVWRGRVSTNSDQYSLAATFADLCLDRPLFAGRDMMQLMYAHLEGAPDLNPLPPEVQRVLLKALSKTPTERFGSCREFYHALEKVLAPELGSPGPAPAVEPESRNTAVPLQTATTGGFADGHSSLTEPARPRRRYLLAGALGAILLFALVGIGLRPGISQPPIYLPADCQPPESGAETVSLGEMRLYKRIVLKHADIPPVDFVLIVKTNVSDPAPFYIMENKVSNKLFGVFAGAHPDVVKNSQWKQGGQSGARDDLGIDKYPDFPVFRVTLEEAHQFAQWLGGEVPSARQWDKAGGRFDHAEGPYIGSSEDLRPGKDIALAAENEKPENVKPMAVGTAARDESLFGCRDMAGNGREWTRTVAPEESRERLVDFSKLEAELKVFLRGQSYRAKVAFHFVQHADIDFDDCRQTRDDIGFRVVIELPPIR